MKFNNGHWRLLPGTEAILPLTVVDVRTEPDALIITGYDHVIQARWNYLNGAIITARFSSPHAGRDPRPAYPLQRPARASARV